MVGTKVTALQGAGERGAGGGQADALSLSSEPNWPSLLDPVLSARTSHSGLGTQGPVWMPVPQGRGQRTQEVWGVLLPALRSPRAPGLARRQSVSHRCCWRVGTGQQETHTPEHWESRRRQQW